MKILVISTWFPYPPDNGSKLRAHYLIRSLAAAHEVTVLAFTSDGSAQTHDFGTANQQIAVIPVRDDPFRHVDAPRLIKYLSPAPLAFRPSRAMQIAVDQAAQAEKWDGVVAVQMPAAHYVRRVQGAVCVVDVDTALSHQLRERYRARTSPFARLATWVSWQKAHRYESSMLRLFDVATVAWRGEVESLQEMAAGRRRRVHVIPNGVDCALNQPDRLQRRPNTLVFNGSLAYRANYDAMRWFLAEVHPLIKMQQPAVSLTITGALEGVDLDGLALDESVHLAGYVADVRSPVAEATAAIAPIRQGGGTRLKILEAMALGTPVVATTKGAEGLEVKTGEHLLLADTPQAFAQAVLTLLDDPELRRRLAENARRLVEANYDWPAIGQRFATLVEEAAAIHRGAPR